MGSFTKDLPSAVVPQAWDLDTGMTKCDFGRKKIYGGQLTSPASFHVPTTKNEKGLQKDGEG